MKKDILNKNKVTSQPYATVKELNDEVSSRKSAEKLLSNYIDIVNESLQKEVINNTSFNTVSKNISGAINELKSNNDSQESEIASKQDIKDQNLTTTDKTIVGAINELNGEFVTGFQTKLTSQDVNLFVQDDLDNGDLDLKNDSNYFKSDVNTGLSLLTESDANLATELLTSNTYTSLTTTDQSVVGAINEVKGVNDFQESEISGKQAKLTSQDVNLFVQGDLDAGKLGLKNDVNYFVSDVTNGLSLLTAADANLATELLTSNTYTSLTTTDKTIVGAINEVKGVNDSQESEIALKQNITDQSLTTTDKTIVGAINEVKGVNDSQESEISGKQAKLTSQDVNLFVQGDLDAGKLDLKNDVNYFASDATNGLSLLTAADANLATELLTSNTYTSLTTTDQSVVGAINEVKGVNDSQESEIALKQNITDQGLTTTDKTIVGAINEVKGVNDSQESEISGKQAKLTSQDVNLFVQGDLDAGKLDLKNDVNYFASDATNGLSLLTAADANLATELLTSNTYTSLTTTDKTIVGAINQLGTSTSSFKYKLIASVEEPTNILSFALNVWDKTREQIVIEVTGFDDDATADTNIRSSTVKFFLPNVDLTTNYAVMTADVGNGNGGPAIITVRLAQINNEYQVQVFQRVNNATTNIINFESMYVYSSLVLL